MTETFNMFDKKNNVHRSPKAGLGLWIDTGKKPWNN